MKLLIETRTGETREAIADVLHVSAAVRRWEDTKVSGVEDVDGNLIPLRNRNRWCPSILLDTGQILWWPEGTVADVHYKVCDEFVGFFAKNYFLGEEAVAKVEGYVPRWMCPERDGYGDYLIMHVDQYGFIRGWDPDVVLEVGRTA